MFKKKAPNAFDSDGDDAAPHIPGRMAPTGGMTGPDAPHMAQPPLHGGPRGPGMANSAPPVTATRGGRPIPPPLPPAGHPNAPPLAQHVKDGGRCPHCGLRAV